MAIVFVHGVANRTDHADYQKHWSELQAHLRRYIAPVISDNPAGVQVLDAYWGDLGARFAWNGAARPWSPLLGMGGVGEESVFARALALVVDDELRKLVPRPSPPAAVGPLVAAGPATGPGPRAAQARLVQLDSAALSDFLVVTIEQQPDLENRVLAVFAADDVAHDTKTPQVLSACPGFEAELDVLLRLVGDRMKVLASEPGSQTLLPQGVGDGLRKAFEKAKEAIARAIDLPGFLVSRAVVEARKPINDFATLFLGDVFAYLGNRDEAGTSIAARVLGRLAEARDAAPGEPLIVLSHSMGGQVVYDLVTHYIAASPEHSGLKIDFWCATASQVALFAELDLFRMRRPDYGAGKPNPRLPHPDAGTLGYWWNVWDQNDFISYTGGQIFEGIDDEEFVSGMSVLSAHGGYLARPNFFRRFADKVKAAKQANWRNL